MLPPDQLAADRMFEPIRRVFRWCSLILLAVMVALPAIQVFLREMIRSPLIGAEELTRFMLICVVFITLPYVISSGASIRMEEFLEIFPKGFQRLAHLLISSSGAVAFGIAASSVLVATLRNLSNATPTLGIPYWVFFSAAFLGLLFAAIECALQFYKAVYRYPLYITFAEEHSPDELPDLERAGTLTGSGSGS